jgi:hypothetical protein
MRTLLLTAALLLSGFSAVAADFGDPQAVKQVRSIVTAKYKHALHASVSHDWALCTAYSGESDLSVVLRRTDGKWKVVDHDGGAYAKENLKSLGVPQAAGGYSGAAQSVSVTLIAA